jgi:ATP-dependent helicase/nuclease subunit B
MFTGPGPRVFGLPPGVDFPAELVRGLCDRLAGQPPERMARVTVYLNTARLRRRVVQCLQARGAVLMPRLRLVEDLAADPLLTGPGVSVSSLGRRLELAVLIDRLLTADPGLAPRSALFDLADSLAALMDEMQGEGVPPERVAGLDLTDHSAHWARAQRFLGLAAACFADETRRDTQARLRLAVAAQAALWERDPPGDPVILAGSTGSRGTTALLMRAVARLPQGAVVLPGHDYDLPAPVWAAMDDALAHEAHPQYRLGHLLAGLDLPPDRLPRWTAAPAPSAARNRLVSLSLRPAPVTDQWLAEGADLGDLAEATQGLSLVEAPSPRHEAMAIALALRGAVEQGQRACLISPDRMLTRRVAAALDRWGLRPDDSAGQPLQQTAPGRLLRLVAQGLGRALSVDQLLALLKHPMTHSGADRGPHQLLTQALELHLRRRGPAFPGADFLRSWAAAQKAEGAAPWGEAIAAVLQQMAETTAGPLPDLARQHRQLAERLARGSGPEGTFGVLWEREAGEEARAAMLELETEGPQALRLAPQDYAPLVSAMLSRREVRSAVMNDDRVQILGTVEARIQGADLVILGGLNEGSWPASAAADPWLNRRLRRDAGLLLPERQVGLSAHDYQMAVSASQVVLTRARRDAEAETVPSRWVNRLTNLLGGLVDSNGPQALEAMRDRGHALLSQVAALESPIPAEAACRPSPRPPVAARPRKLSITQIETLIANPYDIYARHVLQLMPLNPLRPEADMRLRGEVFHSIAERFLRAAPLPPQPEDAARLFLEISETVLAEDVPWPVARAEWRSRLSRIALPFARDTLRRDAVPVVLEERAALRLDRADFTLTGKPDRIDLQPDGTLHVIDYKTGDPPKDQDMQLHRKQLHLAAVMALGGAFETLGPRVTSRITYQSLKPGLAQRDVEMTEDAIREVADQLEQLLLAYARPETGFTARRAAMADRFAGDYDQLSRLGEWTIADEAVALDLEGEGP